MTALFACEAPKTLEGLNWLACYLTTGKHMAFYGSFLTVIALLAVTAPLAMMFGFGGALASRSSLLPVRLIGKGYIAMVRGVPDIVFFLFMPIAFDQIFEYMRHKISCPDVTEPVRQGNDFVVCKIAKLPLSNADQWVHELYGFCACLIILCDCLWRFCWQYSSWRHEGCAKSQIETASAYGMTEPACFQAHYLSANVALRTAGLIKSVADFDQSDAVIILAWR